MSDHLLPDDSHLPDPEVPVARIPKAGTRREAAELGIRDDSVNPADPYEGAVPPGYDWPTHGGYLGCLLGVMASCLIGGFVGSTLFPALAHYNLVPGWVAGLLTLVVFVLLVVGIGRVGYALGRRFLREYPQPAGKTWGEDDDYEHTPAEDVPATDAATADATAVEAATSTGEVAEAEEPAIPQNGSISGAGDRP